MTAELKKWRRIFTALASIWSNIFTNSNGKKTCLLLCLLCIFKFQTLTCQNFWIFYFTSRLTLYECVVNVCIQRWFLFETGLLRDTILRNQRHSYLGRLNGTLQLLKPLNRNSSTCCGAMLSVIVFLLWIRPVILKEGKLISSYVTPDFHLGQTFY